MSHPTVTRLSLPSTPLDQSESQSESSPSQILSNLQQSFQINKLDSKTGEKIKRGYKLQYASIYFMRLAKLRGRCGKVAGERWDKGEWEGRDGIGGDGEDKTLTLLSSPPSSQREFPVKVGRVLDLPKGQLCYLTGTVYVELPAKPNVLDEIAKQHHLIPLPPSRRYAPSRTSPVGSSTGSNSGSAGFGFNGGSSEGREGWGQVMIEDESGRVRLVGEGMERGRWRWCTGVIASVLGAQTPTGEFQVLDVCYAGVPPKLTFTPPISSSKATTKGKRKRDEDVDEDVEMEDLENEKTTAKGKKGKTIDSYDEDEDQESKPTKKDKGKGKARANDDEDGPKQLSGGTGGEWIAFVSGLEMGNGEEEGEMKTEMLLEWLTGELARGEEERREISKISKLVIAGNAMAQPPPPKENTLAEKRQKRYGSNIHFSTAPTTSLDNFLSELLPSIDVEILVGEKDPTGATMPQQPLHWALLSKCGMGKWSDENLKMRTNPCWMRVGDLSLLGSSGQTLDDIFRYVDEGEEDPPPTEPNGMDIDDDKGGKTTANEKGGEKGKRGPTRLSMARMSLEWSHLAPTAPDTLWCYPFQGKDPFLLEHAPDIYFIGNQPKFATTMIEGPSNPALSHSTANKTRLILIPEFQTTGELVLVNSKSLETKVIRFDCMI